MHTFCINNYFFSNFNRISYQEVTWPLKEQLLVGHHANCLAGYSSALNDLAVDKLSYVHLGWGELIICPVLVCVLPFSGYSYVETLPNAASWLSLSEPILSSSGVNPEGLPPAL